MKNKHLAAPCGLYCGICIKFKNKFCGGCHSNYHFCNHKGCEIYSCVLEKGLNWCFECDNFPCTKLENFTKWRSWIGHEDCINNLQRMKINGIDKWLKELE